MSPPTQGDRQPLPSHTPPSFYHSCIPSLGSGGGSQRGKDFITLQHSSQCSWHSCQNLKVKAEFLREPAEGAYSSHLLYFPVGKRMSNTPPPLEVSEVLQSSQLHKDLLAERFPRQPPHLQGAAAVPSAEGHSNTPQLSQPCSALLGAELQTPTFNVPSALPTPSHSMTACPRTATFGI